MVCEIMEVISLKDNYEKCLEECAKALLNEELIVYPTDTVYGIGALATSKRAVEKVYEAKSRNKEKSVSVMVGSLNQIMEFFLPESIEIRYIYTYLPGPYTFIIKAKEQLWHIGKEVGLRVIDHYFCRKLCLLVNAPIVTTSANISGNKAIEKLEDLDKDLEKYIKIAVDGGVLKYGVPSTVVHIRDKKIIRQGAGNFKWLH